MRTYLCDHCDGYGTTNADPRHSHDPARGEDVDCLWCDSTGVITADADTADLRSLQPWTGSIGRAASRIRAKHIDPLHELARARNAGIRGRSAAYAHARQRALGGAA